MRMQRYKLLFNNQPLIKNKMNQKLNSISQLTIANPNSSKYSQSPTKSVRKIKILYGKNYGFNKKFYLFSLEKYCD